MKIVLTELYNSALHGRTSATSPYIDGRRLALEVFEPTEFAEDPQEALGQLACLKAARSGTTSTARLEVARVARLDGGEDVTIVRACPIVAFQRRWRNSRG